MEKTTSHITCGDSEAGIGGLETQKSDKATIGDDDMEVDDMNDMVAAAGVDGLVHSLLIGTLGLDEVKENNESLEQQVGSIHEVMEKRQEGEIKHLLNTYDILEAISNKRFDELRKSKKKMEDRLRELLQSQTIQITDFEEYNVLMDKSTTALCNAIYELNVLVSQIEQEDVDDKDLSIQLEEKGKDVMGFFEVLYDNMETPTDDDIGKDIHNNMFDVKAWLGEIIEAIHNGTVGSIEDMVEEVEVQVKKRKKRMGKVEVRKLWAFIEKNPQDENWNDDQLWKWYNKCNEAMEFAPLLMSDVRTPFCPHHGHHVARYLYRNPTSPFETVDTIDYTCDGHTLTLTQIGKLVSDAADGYDVHFGKKIAIILLMQFGEKRKKPWWFPSLTRGQQVAVEAITHWKAAFHSEKSQVALPYLENLGLCLTNNNVFQVFLGETKQVSIAKSFIMICCSPTNIIYIVFLHIVLV